MSLLDHARGECRDPDCELHQIEVGREEATVSDTDLAFFVAGAQAMSRVRFNGPSCENCRRPLLVVEGRCLCCGYSVAE